MRARASSSSPTTLPRLPVPDLRQTLQKYLVSLEPFMLEDQANGGLPREDSYNHRVKLVEDFERGLGRICQDRLHALDRSSPNNWLDDNFWMKKAYHESRAPLLVNSNWWLAFHNDPAIPDDVILGRPSSANGGITDWQVRRAAWLVSRVLDWKSRLDRQDMYPDTTRAGIWLRNTTAKIFSISRVPQTRCDTLSPLPAPTDSDARKLLVLVHDWFYAVEVVDDDSRFLSSDELERRLSAVVADVVARLENGEHAVPVCVLSADDRDRWTENLGHLLSLSPQNHAILRTIHHSLFALSLDHYTYALPAGGVTDDALPTPCTVPEVTAHLHNVRSGHAARPAHNRWYDKPFTLIVESNTRAGAIGEHSPCDALVPSIVAEYAVVQSIEQDAFGPFPGVTPHQVQGWERLDWVVDEHVERECITAEARAKAIVEDSDDGILWFDAYGTDWIKNTARLSPDSYIQMALQLAWYRTRGCFTATYETALTRLFKNGRTETIRTFTTDSRAFVLAMVDPQSSSGARQSLLQRAVQTHTNLTRQAATGRGIDRHLLGLQMMMLPGERHELFEDEMFARSQTWKLSTSGLSAGCQFRGTGFGASYHDGYGINYLAGSDTIKFGIESKHSHPETSTECLRNAIAHALMDMYQLHGPSELSHL
ncbi:hypothetical protein POSPLADRAFT_1151685 [Postia placenta MAD-698-R-SB12]|uniref:Choline/carnitine acyltransferase domain-containing protein n=1 Tax=Postia placenta MAD-698-R-SB12 TaxID=670580 RepID=A0A1X6MR27_9APHY|nr:hypothetical protein POSPLADRAFT_1151685 [Postia placenta MAD-698-R-SB12]OSX58854.1 hypothetical protein POSPLADRAFT_1151685 [Postia placenta MAD-698-R-SB12]